METCEKSYSSKPFQSWEICWTIFCPQTHLKNPDPPYFQFLKSPCFSHSKSSNLDNLLDLDRNLTSEVFTQIFLKKSQTQLATWRITPVSKWLGSPPFISHGVRPFRRGPITPGLWDLRWPWLITCKSWDDPPSTGDYRDYSINHNKPL